MRSIGLKTAFTCLSFLSALAFAASSELYQIRLKNGDLLTGELKSTSANELVLSTPYAGVITIKRSEVQALTPLRQKSVQPSASAAIPSVGGTVQTTPTTSADLSAKPWSLQLNLSAAARAGQEQAKSYSLTERFEYRMGDWRSQLDANYDYETKEAARKTLKYQLNPGLDYFYSPQLFWRVNAGYSYNYLASDYKNVDFNSGPGYAVW